MPATRTTHRPKAATLISRSLAEAALPNAAAARTAELNRMRQAVVAHAIQNGQSPAGMYYRLAVERAGYAPKIDLSRSEMNRLINASMEGGERFDKMWAQYEKRARTAEQNRRGG